MKTTCSIVVCILVALAAPLTTFADEPLNVLVGDLTFTRPASWKWNPPTTNSPALTRFMVPPKNHNYASDVRFYISRENFSTAKKRWKTFFPETSHSTFKEEKKKIGQREVLFVTLTGTFIYPKSKPHPNFLYFGAVTTFGQEFIHIRMVGPQPVVEPEIAAFRKMVTDALKEKAAEAAE